MKYLLTILFATVLAQLFAQNGVGIGTTAPHASAILDVSSNNRGLLPPRMTALQRIAIADPANGLIVYDTDSAALMLRSAGVWNKVNSNNRIDIWRTDGIHIYNENSGFVGIGNTNPVYKLDVSGRMRIRGGDNNFFSSGLWLAGTGVDSTSDKIFMGMRNDSTAGFYDVAGGWSFNVNGPNGNIGLRNANPRYPLSFENSAGDKIALFAEPNGRYYGMGIGNSSMQLITPPNTDILFGHGSSSNFTESMRLGNGNLAIGTNSTGLAGLTVNKKVGATNAIFGSNTSGVAIESSFPGIGFNNYFDGSRKAISLGYSGYIGVNPASGGMQFLVSGASANAGNTVSLNNGMVITPNGNVGIGINDPVYQLDLGARMRIRGKPGLTAGVWLNNESNTDIPAFVGMQADNKVGFYGSGSNWGFLMNTQTGNIGVGTFTPAAKLEVNGYTKLGTDAPAIKTIKLTGTTASTEGGVTSIDHNLSFIKILSVNVLVQAADANYYAPSYTNFPGFEYHFYVLQNFVRVENKGFNSINMRSRPFRILITYEE